MSEVTATNPTDATKPIRREDGAHWYTTKGEALHSILKKDKKGTRPTTLADAKKLNLLPSVTSILKLLHKPALQDWLIHQAVMAVVTAPDLPNEQIDAKITRVLEVERQQDQEAQVARDKGTEIHDALDMYFSGEAYPAEMEAWIKPVIEYLQPLGTSFEPEVVLVGNGYAGKTDLILNAPDCWWIWDYKTTKKLPTKGAYLEHRLQLAAYAKAWEDKQTRVPGQPDTIKSSKRILTGNLYISSVEPGLFVACPHDSWSEAFDEGFAPLVVHWQWVNNHRPMVENVSPISKTWEVNITVPPPVPSGSKLVSVESAEQELEQLAEPAVPVATPPAKTAVVKGKRVALSAGVPTPQPQPPSVQIPSMPAPPRNPQSLY